MDIKLFVATRAFINYKGKILILRESSKYSDGTKRGKYDAVGGRIEPGERFDLSLLREVKEETVLEVKLGKPFFVNEWRPIVRDEQWQIVATFFECFSDSDKVTLSKDHDQYLWIDPNVYKKYALINTITPAFEAYLTK